MDVLTNKQTRSYTYTSRYAPYPFYYHTEDKKYIYGLTGRIERDFEYSLHKVEQADTLDGLALKYYGRPDLYWVICEANLILDPYINLKEKYNFLYIPALSSIRWSS